MEKWKHLKIPLADIKHATNSFQKEIGRGGYGWVYEGELSFKGKHTKIAVKKLNEKHGQGLKEFLTEIDLLSGQQHENIITLVGYCDEGNEKIIVYEYAEHGSLDQYLWCNNTTKYTLSWLERLKIVVDAARGLDHLHNHLRNNQVIIHRDIKSSNILLDHNWVAKISDLGLAKSTFSGFDRTSVISHACGTMGYLEPEYIRYGLVSKKSDVYSFGMVLFEVLCGRSCTIRDKDGILLLADVAKEHYENNKLDMLIHPYLGEQMSPEALSRYSAIAYKCLLGREHRPPIDVVKKELEETLKIECKDIRRLKSSEEGITSDHYSKKELRDGDKCISFPEPKELLQDTKSRQLTWNNEKTMEEIMKEFDKDSDEKVTMDEFVERFKKWLDETKNAQDEVTAYRFRSWKDLYEIIQPWALTKKKEQKMMETLISELTKHVQSFTVGSFYNEDGTTNISAIKRLFESIDLDKVKSN